MNVLLVVPWDQALGGVAAVIGNLATQLEKSGHKVVFLHPGPPDRRRQRITALGFTGYEINLRAPWVKDHPLKSVLGFMAHLVQTLHQIASLIRAHRIQLVSIHYPTESFVYFGILRWLLPIRLAVSVHGADLFPDGRRMERYPVPLRFLLWCSDALVAPSKAFLRDCLSAFPRAAGKSVAIHNGVDIEELEIPDQGKAADSRPYLLCIAAHSEKKALDVLLQAFAQTVAAHPDYRLLLAGDGPLRPQLEDRARSLALQQHVEFLGEKQRPEIARLLHGCAFFVLPSRAEPFGMVVTEAMACHKAVVATAVGGIPEIVDDGRTGILVKPDDPAALARAMATMLEDGPLREAMADAGYRRVLGHFRRERMGEEYVALFFSLLNNAPLHHKARQQF